MVNKYKNKTFNVPFYEATPGLHKVKIKIDTPAEVVARSPEFIESAYRKFITSYFPEFYSYLYDEEYFQDNCDPNSNNPNCGVNILEVAVELKETLKDLIVIESTFATSPPSSKTIVILKLRYDFDAKREELENTSRMPLYQPNLDFFNQREGISDSIDQTTLTVGTIGTENKLLNNGLRTFDTQYKGFEGQIDLNVDFGYMSIATTKILNILVTELTKQLRIQSPSYDFAEADTLTLFFGKKQGKLAISGINYLLIEKSIQSEPLKIGYFSIIKNNKMIQDPLTLAVLRNYQQMLTSIQGANNSKTSYSFFEFLDDDTVKDSLNTTGSVFSNFNPQPKKEINNELLKVANEYGLIDVNNVDALEKGFKTFVKTGELRKLKQEVANNPDIYKRVNAAQQAKVLNTGVDVTKVVGSILEQGPLGFADQNPQIKYLFRQLGIDELAKEAFLCMTFGMNMELGRINKAVQNSLVRASSSIYYPPDKPKASPINKPSIDLEMFKPFTVSGDLWKEVEKAIIDAIQQAVLEIIKKLAELLRENCNLNTPRSSDYGQNDLVDFIENNPNPENSLLPIVGDGSQLDQIASKNGLSNEQILKYLTDLSSILSSIDICILLMNREDASDELLDRILEFNQTYELDIVRTNLNSISDILGFFGDLAAIVDVTDLCNQIANELYDINQDNICLDDLGDENIQELLDLIENGLTVDLPNLDLDCPDSKFLDPTIKKSIPETFNALAESIQIQFISSADSAKQILLEPVLSNESPVLSAINAAGVQGTGSPIDMAFLTPIITALDGIGTTINLEDCPIDLPAALGFDPATFIETGVTALDLVTDTLNNPDLVNAISGMAEKIGQIAPTDAPDNPVFTTYKFNQEFINKFRGYIQPETFVLIGDRATTTDGFYSSEMGVTAFDTDVYKDLTLDFAFSNNGGGVLAEIGAARPNSLQVIFPEYLETDDSRSNQAELRFNLDQLVSTGNTSLITSGSKEAPLSLAGDPIAAIYTENLFLSLFAKPFVDNSSPPLDAGDILKVYYETFPKAYGSLVNSTFDYVLNNGVFDAATLQSMNLFTLNEGCPPEDLSDFLDIQGIVDQMIEEYREAACGGDDSPLSSKIRNVIKYGMYQLLIQISIAEVIIKNIFVMSAFNLDSLLDKDNFVFQFIRGQILHTLLQYLDQIQVSDENLVRQDLTKYFNLKIKRGLVMQKGGISYSDGSIAFPNGTQFSVNDADTFIGFDEILDFLISDRIQRSKNSINNALKKALPNKKQASFEEAVLSGISVLEMTNGNIPIPGQQSYQGWVENFISEVIEEADFYGEGFYIVKDTVGTENIRTRASLWYYNSITLTQIIAPFYIASEIQEPGAAGIPELSGDFVVTEGLNDRIWIVEGFGTHYMQIPAGIYNALTISTAVNIALNGNEDLNLTYFLGYNTQTRLFNISNAFGAEAFGLPNGSHSSINNLLTKLLGWDDVDVSGEAFYSASVATEEI